jgi:hypothetical protein
MNSHNLIISNFFKIVENLINKYPVDIFLFEINCKP